MSELSALHWLIRAAVGGGTILLVAWWLMRRIESPARRQRLGEGALIAAFLVAALSLMPGWITVPLPVPVSTPTEPAPAARVETLAPASPDTTEFADLIAPEDPLTEDVPLIEDGPAVAAVAAAEPTQPEGWSVAGLIVAAYGCVALGILAWRLAGHVVLWC